eukprot:scaffold187736_cov40-Prasinocladus_malaysianus.AAC.2
MSCLRAEQAGGAVSAARVGLHGGRPRDRDRQRRRGRPCLPPPGWGEPGPWAGLAGAPRSSQPRGCALRPTIHAHHSCLFDSIGVRNDMSRQTFRMIQSSTEAILSRLCLASCFF